MEGVVLLDLPDHDSTEVSHHLEVDRIVKLADLLVWVLDPQKYADAAVHDRYLAPLASHAERHGRRAQPHRHRAGGAARRRCSTTSAGCSTRTASRDVPVIATSARHGDGHRRAARRDRPAGRGQEVHPAAARGRPARGRGPAQRGVRHAASPARSPRGGCRRWRRRWPTPAGVPTVVVGDRAVDPAAGAAGHRLAGRLVALPAASRTRCERLHLDLGADGQAADRSGRGRRSPRPRPSSAPRSTPRCARSPTTCRPG